MRIAIASLLMALSVCGCSTSRSAAICGRVTNGTYVNEPLGFGLRLAEGWSIVPNTETERAVTAEQGSRPVEQALVTAVKTDDEGSAVIVCLLSPVKPEQVFANTALKFAQESQTGTVDRVNINGLELLHRQNRYGYRGSNWLSDLYVCERDCGTLAVLVTQNEEKQLGPADKLLREMLIGVQRSVREPGPMPEEFKARLAAWRHDDGPVPDEVQKAIKPEMDIRGEWQDAWFSPVHLSISTNGDGVAHAAFDMHGCLARWEMETKFGYTNGVITLEHPVIDYGNSIYDTLYAISCDGRDYMVPKCKIPVLVEMLRMLERDPSVAKDSTLKRRAFRFALSTPCFHRAADEEQSR